MSIPTNQAVTQPIVDRWYANDGTQTLVGDIPISEIADKFGTPFYIHDADIVRQKVESLKQALPNFDIHYSVKANPNPSIIKLLLENGCGMETASKGELDIALACGCEPSRILFAGPGKSDSELLHSLRKGIGEIHVESEQEIHRLDRIAAQENTICNIALRVNPSEGIQGGAQQMGGKPTAFGIDEEELDSAVRLIAQKKSLKLTGLHVYSGTQILNANLFGGIYSHIAGIAKRIVEITGEPLQMIDFGGGFGIPYFHGEPLLDLVELRNATIPVVENIRNTPGLENTKLIVEPGRFLTAEAGIYVAKVIATKTSRGQIFAVMDGGLNHHLSASGNLGQIIKKNFPIAVLNKINESGIQQYNIVGPLCTPLDTVGRSLLLPKIEPGDLIGIFQSGAYARTSSPHGFLSHPSPMEIMVSGGKLTTIRTKGDSKELTRGTYLDG